MVDFLDLDEIAHDVLVVGTSHYPDGCKEFYRAAIDAGKWGPAFVYDTIKISLKREPDNPNDSYAIRVSGRWETPEGRRRTVTIGYVPRNTAYMIDENADEEDKLYGEFSSIEPHEEYLFDIRINIYIKYSGL